MQRGLGPPHRPCHHRYATVLIGAETGERIDVLSGRRTTGPP
ncbi:hypothetical protein [Nonomuraea rubra]|uniref:Uncharacterized protein n=1 Tax=Nonomuraea rubra TaxID=46180 RepID=A0A7X0U0B2_9ACTN|nr:hypothetical protein [Nonomuraea rubra]MBB6550441.1 hypothetical protein [Nonomuraea rubra]